MTRVLVTAGLLTALSALVSPGTAHEWLSFRRAFNHFAPRLFK